MSTQQSMPEMNGGTIVIGDDMPVRRLGFGAMRLCGPGVWGEPLDPGQARRVLKRVIELGFTLIDTADAYGPNVSEQLIAEPLYPYPEGVVIATKGGLTRSRREAWERNGRPEHLRAACEGSLRRLRLQRIDLYQLHAPDPRVPLEDSVGALADLQAAGKIRHIGLSNISIEELRRARRVAPIVSVQNRYNLSDRASEDVVDECEKEGIAFLPWHRADGRWQPVSGMRQAFFQVLNIVTAFTVAHSITLSLAVLGVVAPPARLVESLIAFSVPIAAANNLVPLVTRRLWCVAFVFGLIHRFGFANVLMDLGLPKAALALALFGFNLGVELGQVAIVLAFLPLAFAISGTWSYRGWVMPAASLAVAGIAALWLVERSLDLDVPWV